MILFVCSFAKSRSRTAEILCQLGGLDARCAGTNEMALSSINSNIIASASHIYCMEREHAAVAREMAGDGNQRIEVLGIPDIYQPFEMSLIEVLLDEMRYRDESIYKALFLGSENYLRLHPGGFVVERQQASLGLGG